MYPEAIYSLAWALKVKDFVKVKGMRCPTYIASLDGPRPVNKYHPLPLSTQSNIFPKSLPITQPYIFALPMTEEVTATEEVMWCFAGEEGYPV